MQILCLCITYRGQQRQQIFLRIPHRILQHQFQKLLQPGSNLFSGLHPRLYKIIPRNCQHFKAYAVAIPADLISETAKCSQALRRRRTLLSQTQLYPKEIVKQLRLHPTHSPAQSGFYPVIMLGKLFFKISSLYSCTVFIGLYTVLCRLPTQGNFNPLNQSLYPLNSIIIQLQRLKHQNSLFRLAFPHKNRPAQ